MNVAEYLLDNNTSDGKVALITQQGEYTYADIKHLSEQVAAFLLNNEATKGDRIALISDSSHFWVSAYLGTILAGCVSVPLQVNIDPEQCSYILEKTQCRIGFLHGRYVGKYMSVFDEGSTIVIEGGYRKNDPPTQNITTFSEISSSAGTDLECKANIGGNDDLAALMFTSGSTGEPRGVMITHRNIIANTDSIIKYLELKESDRIMAVLPFYYCFGTSLLHTHLKVGGTIVYDGRFMYPDKVLERMKETRCTGFAGVPSTYQILLRNSGMKNMEFPDLQHVQQAGGKLSETFLNELRETLPRTRVFVMYGQTEATARLSFLQPEELDTRPSSIGRGIPGVRLSVLDDEGNPVEPGAAGEIVAEGDNIGLGYWGSPEESAQSFHNGKLYTGDIATVDKDGYIYIVDRAKDFIKCGGTRSSCREIEDIILKFEGTVEAAVVGHPDEILGEAVCLYIVHPDGPSVEESLFKFCGKNLPWQLVPRRIVFLDSLPKTNTGKVNKGVLKQEVISRVKRLT